MSDTGHLRDIADMMDDHGIGVGDHSDAPTLRAAADEIERLRVERDELLAACAAVLSDWERMIGSVQYATIDRLTAAVAKAKGGAP